MTSAANRILLLLRTVVWLRPVQIYWRIWLKLSRPRPREFSDVGVIQPQNSWHPTGRTPSMTGPDEFRFLNQTHAILSAADWNAPDRAKLWLYNAHYFDDLVADGAADREEWHRELIRRWIAENPPASGNGWEPYPTSLRIVNWCKWLLMGNSPEEGMLGSLATQADWLSRRLEYHLLGNHLFANAKALTFAGAVLDHEAAQGWLATGLRILEREVPEQILSDGGHFERSVMYHAILTEDLLDLVQLAQILPGSIPASSGRVWQDAANRAIPYLNAMTHLDGGIAFFNDGAFGIAPETSALNRQAIHLGCDADPDASALAVFPESGYARLSTGNAVLIADTAPIGPGYLPGHAHADTLSFELSIGSHRVFVNGGTSVYGGDADRRMLERSTRYHNTVEIDGANSSEIWAEFRVARRAEVLGVDHGSDGDTIWLQASHDGYRRINGPIHTRRWELSPGRLTIKDTLDRPAQTAIARFRIAPGFSATADTLTGAKDISLTATGGTVTVEQGTWSPEFGKVLPCEILALAIDDRSACLTLTWEP
ncbi:MAG: alginate lyase family protein [Pseudomonadota bacterium]